MSATVNSRFFVREDDVPAYHPANHTGTVNRRLIGPQNVGARNLEVVLGVIEKGKGALPHAHPGIEQVCYLLEGRARETHRVQLECGERPVAERELIHQFFDEHDAGNSRSARTGRKRRKTLPARYLLRSPKPPRASCPRPCRPH